MPARSKLLLSLVCVAAALAAGCESLRPQSTEEWDGLVRQRSSRLRALFLKPDADIASYHSVVLDPVEVSFARNWSPNRGGGPGRGLNAADVAAIQTGLAELFHEVFASELAGAGYAVVSEPGPDTLRVRAAIVDLYVTVPDALTRGSTRTYTANSGRMTLVLELRDSVTGEILARAVDPRAGRGSGSFHVTNRVTNTADARRVIRVWASGLLQALNELYGRGGDTAGLGGAKAIQSHTALPPGASG